MIEQDDFVNQRRIRRFQTKLNLKMKNFFLLSFLNFFGRNWEVVAEVRYSEFIPDNVDCIQRHSVAQNCLLVHKKNDEKVRECMGCFTPLTPESIKCYDQFFSKSDDAVCNKPAFEEINESNMENIVYNLTTCVDHNLRHKIIKACSARMGRRPASKVESYYRTVDKCVVESYDDLFGKTLAVLQEPQSMSSNEKILFQILELEINNKCKVVSSSKYEDCSRCFKKSFQEGAKVSEILTRSRECAKTYLNPNFELCFEEKSIQNKESPSHVKRGILSCIHKNIRSVVSSICINNLRNQFHNNPKTEQLYSLISACVDYRMIKAHDQYYPEGLKASLKLLNDYKLVVDGVVGDVLAFFDTIHEE